MQITHPNRIIKQSIFLSPAAKSIAITTTVLGAISTLASATLYASKTNLIALGPASALFSALPSILPIALCSIGAVAILVSAVFLIMFKKCINSQYWQGKDWYSTSPHEFHKARAFELFSKAASSGHVMAQLFLARCYRSGIGCTKDKRKGFELVQKIANKGLPIAQLCMVECYDLGIGCEQDQVKAFELLKRIASKGFLPAQFMMAEHYANEDLAILTKCEAKIKTFDQVKVEAIRWYTLAANSKVKGIEELSGKPMSFYIQEAKKSLEALVSE